MYIIFLILMSYVRDPYFFGGQIIFLKRVDGKGGRSLKILNFFILFYYYCYYYYYYYYYYYFIFFFREGGGIGARQFCTEFGLAPESLHAKHKNLNII